MGNSVSPGLGNSANHGLRDVGLAEPSKEVERSIASPALTNSKEINRKSRFPLPVPPKPYIVAQLWGCEVQGYEVEHAPKPNLSANSMDKAQLRGSDLSSKANPTRMDTPDNTNSFVLWFTLLTNLSSKANPMQMDTPDDANSFVQRGTWNSNSNYVPNQPITKQPSATVRPFRTEIRPEVRRQHTEAIELDKASDLRRTAVSVWNLGEVICASSDQTYFVADDSAYYTAKRTSCCPEEPLTNTDIQCRTSSN